MLNIMEDRAIIQDKEGMDYTHFLPYHHYDTLDVSVVLQSQESKAVFPLGPLSDQVMMPAPSSFSINGIEHGLRIHTRIVENNDTSQS